MKRKLRAESNVGHGRPSVSGPQTTILYFARVKSPSLLTLVEFYREDLEIFRELGYEVVAEHRYRPAVTSQADVLYAWWGATALPVVLAWRLRRRKCVLTGALSFRDPSWPGEGPVPLRYRLRRWIRKVLILLASRLADSTLAISEFELEDLRRAGIRGARLVRCAVDVDYFRPGVPVDTPIAVTVAQCNRGSILRKGVDVCVESAEIVRRHVPDYRLLIAGPIAQSGRDWLDEMQSRLDFSGIELLGEVTREEKLALLQSSWLYLQPSVYEAFGVAMVEAMACGTVPVCSANGALSEVVGEGGLVLPERTSEALAASVVELLQDEGLRRTLSVRARERALVFSRATRRRELAAILDEVLA